MGDQHEDEGGDEVDEGDGEKDDEGDGEKDDVPGRCEGKVDGTEEKIRNGQTDFEIGLLKTSTDNIQGFKFNENSLDLTNFDGNYDAF